jgi:hypothetical protein
LGRFVVHFQLLIFVLRPNPQAEQTLCFAWKDNFPHLRQVMWLWCCRLPIDGVPFDILIHPDYSTEGEI